METAADGLAIVYGAYTQTAAPVSPADDFTFFGFYAYMETDESVYFFCILYKNDDGIVQEQEKASEEDPAGCRLFSVLAGPMKGNPIEKIAHWPRGGCAQALRASGL